MPNVIQHNAAKILALSMLLFTGEVAASNSKNLAPRLETLQDDLLAEPNTPNNNPSLAAA